MCARNELDRVLEGIVGITENVVSQIWGDTTCSVCGRNFFRNQRANTKQKYCKECYWLMKSERAKLDYKKKKEKKLEVLL